MAIAWLFNTGIQHKIQTFNEFDNKNKTTQNLHNMVLLF